MEIDAIIDRKTLERWLNTRPEDTRQSDAIAIAFRAACRVMPLFGRAMNSAWAREDSVTALPILRCLLTSGVARKYPTPEVKAAARVAAADDAATTAADDAANVDANVAATAYAAAYTAAYAAAATTAAVATAATTAAAADAADAYDDEWDQIRNDCRALDQGQDPDTMALWHDADNPLLPAWAETRDLWQKSAPAYDFWLRWYQALLDATPLPPALLRAIALIPDAEWQRGPERVAEVIVGISRSHAITATGNGERLEVNPATGLIRLVGETDLPDDIAAYARRKMARALALFGGNLENQYRPLEPAFKVVQDALADGENLPVELFDACASCTRMVATQVRNEVVPKPDQDAQIAEFVTLIREAGADILAYDAKTQDTLARRKVILGNTALIDNRDAILDLVMASVKISEGSLIRVLPRDGAIATNAAADPGDRKDASYRLAGRLLRYGVAYPTVGLGVAGAAIDGAASIIGLAQQIIASPAYQQAIAAILRYLGFG